MKEKLPQHLFDKYLKGNCTPAEEAVVKEWYNSFVNDDDLISSYTNLKKDDLKLRIKNAIDENIRLQEKTQIPPPLSSKPVFQYWVYTAGIAAMLVVALGIFFYSGYNKQAVVTQQIISAQSADKIINITNNTKTIQEQVLSDGSHVWLYPGAKIKFIKKFTGNVREVNLVGKSFFDVAKNPAKPFIIYTEHMITKVWGTSFMVRDTHNETFADVAVVTGKVSVTAVKSSEDNPREVMLHPNEQVTYIKNKQLLQAEKAPDIKELKIWKKINLSFDNQPLKEIIPVLNKFYQVDIKTEDDTLNDYLLTADFAGLNFVSVMEILNKTFNINYEITNTGIILKNNNL